MDCPAVASPSAPPTRLAKRTLHEVATKGIEFRRPDLTGRGLGQGTQLCSSTQQLVNDGFDVNDGCIEKLDTRSAGVAQQQRELRACKD